MLKCSENHGISGSTELENREKSMEVYTWRSACPVPLSKPRAKSQGKSEGPKCKKKQSHLQKEKESQQNQRKQSPKESKKTTGKKKENMKKCSNGLFVQVSLLSKLLRWHHPRRCHSRRTSHRWCQRCHRWRHHSWSFGRYHCWRQMCSRCFTWTSLICEDSFL